MRVATYSDAGRSAAGIMHMRDYIYLAVLLISFPGYPMIAAGANLIGIESTTVSLVVRTVNAALAAALVLSCYNRPRSLSSNLVILLCLVFWAFYLFRIFLDTIYAPAPLGQDLSYYWIWAVGGSLLPMLGLALKPCRPEQADQYFRWFYLATLFAGLLALLSATGSMESDLYGVYATGRMRISDNRLNPIALGHLGAMLALQSIWALLFFRTRRNIIQIVSTLIGLCIGFYILLAANSRGPILAFAACMIFIILYTNLRHKIFIFSIAGIVILTFVPLADYLEQTQNIPVFSRLFGTSLSENAEQSMRPYLYNRAITIFVENPWFGGALEDPLVLSYPHNVIIESFMATGVLFGIVFLCLIFLAFWISSNLLNRSYRFGWISILYIQYIVGAQFSGSLYGSTYLWCAIGLIMSASNINLREKRYRIK